MIPVKPEPTPQEVLPIKTTKQAKTEAWQIITTTFITVFIAELGDKTQLTTLVIAAQSHQPWIVFMGAAIALVSTSLLGVLAGKWLAKTFSPSLLNTLAGLSFLVLSISLLWDAIA